MDNNQQSVLQKRPPQPIIQENFDNSQGQIIRDYKMLFTNPDKNMFIRLKDFYKLNDI